MYAMRRACCIFHLALLSPGRVKICLLTHIELSMMLYDYIFETTDLKHLLNCTHVDLFTYIIYILT